MGESAKDQFRYHNSEEYLSADPITQPGWDRKQEFGTGMTYLYMLRFISIVQMIALGVVSILLIGIGLFLAIPMMLSDPMMALFPLVAVGALIVLMLVLMIPVTFGLAAMRFFIFKAAYRLIIQHGSVKTVAGLEVFNLEDVIDARVEKGPFMVWKDFSGLMCGQPYGKEHVVVRVRRAGAGVLVMDKERPRNVYVDVDDPERFVRALGCPVIS